MIRHLLLAGTAVLAPAAGLAQTTDLPQTPPPAESGSDQQRQPHRPSRDPYHSEEEQNILVTGFTRSREDVLSGTSVVAGEELDRELRSTIGETLARQAGVSATSFGPGVSRPVLRGFQGERVRVLTDGIGSLDISNTSVDHSVSINPLTADRIEVLRGPSVLLFGSSAIGGIVNVIDSRIPRRVPDEPVHVDGIATYGSAADEISLSGAVDVPIGGEFVVHVDGSYIDTDDLDIGGFVLARPLREQAAASPDPAIQELAELRGTLPNTALRTTDFAGGVAWIRGQNNVGFSINRYDSRYGIPVRLSLDPAVEAEEVSGDDRQTRIDGRAEIDTGDGFIDTVRLRGGWSDYRHFEIENETGEVATTFNNDSVEGRIEARQTERNGWGGGFGGQYYRRELEAIGAEKFLPPNTTDQFGLFVLQTLERGRFRGEAGARYEHSRQRADADVDLGNPDLRRSFDAFSASLGGSVELAPGIRVGLNGTRSERAPSAEELFANGPHVGTQAFEIGNPDFSTEKSWGLEGTLRGEGEGYSFGASIFHSWFDGYIEQVPTGDVEDDLPVFQFIQEDARYYGFEVEGSVRLATVGGVTINADGVADYVRARIVGFGPAPRIPPFRLLGGLEAQSEDVDGRVEVEWVDDQDRIAEFETPTEGYTMVNASLAFHPFGESNSSSIILSANNIFDVDARRHASFLKDFAPLAGRDFRVTARLTF